MLKSEKSIIVRFEQSNEQTVGEITKVVGLVRARHLIPVINELDLDANPRSSKTGNVTDAIQSSINDTPVLFPFKTKGILLATSQFERMERNRYKIIPTNKDIEGILDGGHNTLAIGIFILKQIEAFKNVDVGASKKQLTWNDFKLIWEENEGFIQEYIEALKSGNVENVIDFLVPVELLLPRNPEDDGCVGAFKNDLLEICDARNNNAELTIGAKANQKGYFADLKSLMEKENKELSDRIEWKTNEGGDIKVQDIIALAWIPLSLVENIKDEKGKVVEPPAANKLYSGKGSCLQQFDKLMTSPDVTMKTSNDYKQETKNTEVISAFEVAVKIPELYDYIYEMFPRYYNNDAGKYGRIIAVKKLNTKRDKRAKFSNNVIETLSPEGFIMPLVYGLQALMIRDEENGFNRITWRKDIDPKEFLIENLEKIVKNYKDILAPWGYDPQKVGKAPESYTQALNAFKMAMHGLL